MKFRILEILKNKYRIFCLNHKSKTLVIVLIALLSVLIMMILSYKSIKEKSVFSIFENVKLESKIDDGELNKIISNIPLVGNKVVLLWDMMYGEKFETSRFDGLQYVDVVSPTWFQVKTEKGSIINRMNTDYIKEAHKKNLRVWALLSNDFNSPTMTSKFLANKDSRNNLISQLLAIYVSNGIDGINIDFERVDKKDSANFMIFIKQLSKAFKEKGKAVSIDVSVSQSAEFSYNETTLGELTDAVDFVIIMAYDQFWSGSKVAGPVSSLAWSEENLIKHLKLNSKTDKIILGIPFYTRLWEEKTDAKGKVNVSGKTALSISSSKAIVKQSRSFSSWDEAVGQYFAKFAKNDVQYKMWIEDENSVELRTALTLKYKLRGVACWSRGFETSVIWDVINKNIKQTKTYEEWKQRGIEPELNLE